VRIISASHKDLDAMVASSEFRQDLYYRINVIGVNVPSLSDHADDIPQLVDFLIEKHNYQSDVRYTINADALAALQAYSFPGNVRELENILERALALCENDLIDVSDLQLPQSQSIADISVDESQSDLGEMTRSLEKEQIASALENHRWNQSATARALGLTLRQLRYRIEKLNLKR
jgi:two-component system response regulator PilR (NtrC family)